MEAFVGLVLSVLLVIVYECVSKYISRTYHAHRLLFPKLVLLVLLAVELRIWKKQIRVSVGCERIIGCIVTSFGFIDD